MKKIILSLILLLLIVPLSSNAWELFMDKCIKSWIGYPLDSVIKSWGYPDYEKNIAGKKLYIWETYDYSTDIIPDSGMSITSTDKKGNETPFSLGEQTRIEYCKKILETNDNGIIINGQWSGNSCPMFYIGSKKLVNPENNEWETKKTHQNK